MVADGTVFNRRLSAIHPPAWPTLPPPPTDRYDYRKSLALLAILALWTVLAACGSEAEASTAVPAAESPTSEGKLSANNATEEELLEAFEAAGISNAEQRAP